jgi:dihydroflavonol-4-reductase
MPTLVTGATGFLGRHLIDALLARGDSVRALVRPQTDASDLEQLGVDVARGDVLQPATLTSAMRGVGRVYHTAALVELSASDDRGMIRTNSDGTRNVLDAAWRAGVQRVVYTSSVGAIGAGDVRTLLSEDDIYRGRGTNLPYTRSKVLADREATRFLARGLPLVPVYPTLFMGPGDRYLRTSRSVLAFLLGRAPAYIAGGFGLTDVRDVARGHVLAMERGIIGRRYILGGTNVSLFDFYQLLARVTGRRAPTLRIAPFLGHVAATLTKWAEPIRGKPPVITHGDVDNARLYWYYDYTRARKELGLECRLAIDTLRDTVSWLQTEVLGGKLVRRDLVPAGATLAPHARADAFPSPRPSEIVAGSKKRPNSNGT